MAGFIKDHFYLIDFAIGGGTPIIVTVLYLSGLISRFTWRLFWVGCLIGLTWEIPLSTLDHFNIVDVFRFATPPPAHFSVIIISHTFWDGGLFLLGVLLVKILCKPPHFTRFSGRELAVLMVWGQASELWVELTSTGNGGWEYNPAWWNPSMFMFNGSHITLAPQLIWLAAPILFYFCALKLGKKGH
jgi:hypothetical protein